VRIQTGNGLARRIHLALIALLSLGLVGSFWLSLRARSEAESAAVRQARDIVEDSLTVVFQPDDLAAPVSGDRLRELAREVDDVVVDPSDFDHVTLFSGSGEILFSTEDGEIGQRLAGERTPVRDAFQGEPQVRIAGDAFSVLVGLRFPSGVGETAAIELTRPLTQITAAAGPWRTNMLFLGGALALVIVAVAGGGRRIEDEGPRDLRIRVPVIAARQPAQQTVRSIEAPQPGLKEEAEARRRAEGRAKSAEERLAVLQEQYRTTLDELQTTQRTLDERPLGQDRVLEERAVKAEAAARSLEQRLHTVTVERDRIASELLAVRDDAAVGGVDQLHQAEAEAMGLRAELEGAQTQLSLTLQELTSIQRQAERARELQEELDAAQLEALHARDAMDAMQEELRSGRTELEDARGELRALRNEEQRATELSDEVRAARAELDSLRASHRAELVEREADLEDKVRTLREEFQAQLAEAEARHTEQVARMRQEHALEVSSATRGAAEASARVAETGADLEAARAESQARAVDLESAKAELQAAHDRIEELQRATDERTADAHQATDEAERARSERDAAATELSELRTALAEAQGLLAEERSRREQLEVSGSRVTDEAHAADERATQLAEELEAAAVANADLNRRLQEIEARRALEIADDEGRAHIDELLTATQERLAGQTEKLMAAEERVRELERRSEVDVARVEELEAQLRQHQMSDQIREIQGKHEARDEVRPDGEPDAMDRQGATAFVREMSIDAQKTVARMLGIVQLLKHKRDAAKEHAQLVQQLTAYARRLDNTIHDLSDVDSLVTGTIELELRRTDLEPLIRRVVDESGIGEEHDIRVEAESLRIPVDRVRTEQIVAGLLSSAADRTSAGKTITVRLIREKTGATIVIEVDAAEVSLSPMMRRLAEVQGGWAKAGARDGGGSEVRVFLPAGGAAGSAPEEPAPVEPIAETPSDLAPEEDPNHWVKAEQALVRELRELSQGKARK
jgi:chromosome segregation ATPase